MPRYLLLLMEDFVDYPEAGSARFDRLMSAHTSLPEAVVASGGQVVESQALHPVATATFLRGTRTPEVTVVDNPTPDLKETLGGYYLVEATGDAHALELAKQCPAPGGYVELRKVWDFDS